MKTTDTSKYQAATAVVDTKKVLGCKFKWFRMGTTNSIVCYYPSGAKLEVYYSQSELAAKKMWEEIQ